MSRYNQYGNYYDPVGSQSNQPSGYKYQQQQQQQSTTSASAYPNTATSYQNYGSSTYGNQNYSGQSANNSATHAAAALSSLSSQDNYNQSWHNPSSTSNSYSNNNNGNLALPNRSQSNNSPLYANSQQSASFGQLSVPAQQTQSSSNTFAATSSYQNAPSNAETSNRSYQSTHSHPAQSQPPRYNSPLHAIQAQQQQQGQNKQSSHSGSNHQPSPRMAQAVRSTSRQRSASVEPSPTTVDPSQVYDNRAELQRKAQIEAERRRKYEAEQAAKRAEEERVEAEKRKVEEEKEAEVKKAEQVRKNEERRKAREEKRQSKSAATALQQMASMGGGNSDSSAPPANAEEAEMRAMFQKMREFNAKNPAMLAKLWEEERKSHASSSSPQPAKAATPQKISRAAPPTTAAAGPASSLQQPGSVRPSKRTTTPPKAPKGAASGKTAQPAPQQQQQPTTTSLWPPHKKGALAEATSKWLMSLPGNSGKAVSAESIKKILDSNPSYVQLCESLENLGLKFERSNLARELLKAVPDGLKAQPVPKPAAMPMPLGAVTGTAAQVNGSPNTPKKKAGQKKSDAESAVPEATAPSESGTVNYEAPLSLADAAREVNNMDRPTFQPANVQYSRIGQNAQQSPYFTQPPNSSRPPSQSQSQSQPPEIKPKVVLEELPPRPPADKEEAARKRTFGDLVDLTADDSDEEEGPPKKVVQPPSGPVNGVKTQRDPLAYLQHQPYHQFNHATNLNPAYNVPGRSVLQSTGPSPAVVPSNVPPEPHRKPQQVPPLKPKGPAPEQLQQLRIRGKMLVEPIMRDRVARKSKYNSRTIARDVLLATGRHPDMRALNGHMATMQKLLGTHGGEIDSGGQGNRSDLATIRWDVIDPEASKEKDAEDSDNVHVERDSVAARPIQSDLQRYKYQQSPLVEQQQEKPRKKKGRPPRHSMPDPTLTNGNLGDTSKPTPRPATTSSRPATPSSAPTSTMAATGTPVGYAAFRSYDPDGNVVKKKGRPIGWRKNVHSREAQGLEPKSHPGKPSLPSRLKADAKQQVGAVVEPRYSVYKCEWEGCNAELHNLDMLKKHLLRVHGMKNAQELLECWWKGCSATGGGPRSFADVEAWLAHVDRDHLLPVAWRLGDGPKGDITSRHYSYHHSAENTTNTPPPPPPSYLSDSQGRSVTPVISPQPNTTTQSNKNKNTTALLTSTMPPSAAAGLPQAKRLGRPPKDGSGAGTSEKDEREPAAQLRKLEAHMRTVGPTMGRLGCVLVSPERRRTFLDGEDFEDVVFEDGSEFDDGDDGEGVRVRIGVRERECVCRGEADSIN